MVGRVLRILFVLSCLLLLGVASEPDIASESRVMAGMVINLARFVTWPSDAAIPFGSPVHMCVTGDDRLFTQLEDLARTERISMSPILVRRVTKPREMQACQVFFIGIGSDRRFFAVTEPTLTVSLEPGFAEAGGVIELGIAQGKVSFQINVKAAERVRLQISSRLLALARNSGRLIER